MSDGAIEYSVFTKPWRETPLPALGAFVKGIGFDGVELPVRPGYQVEPENVTRGLPEAAKILVAEGVKIASVAGPTDEATIAACAEAGVPIIRVCVGIPAGVSYLDHVAAVQAEYDHLLPLLDKHGVTIGVQNHNGRNVAHAMGMRQLVAKYAPAQVGAVYDPAHCALDGEIPELALDIVWSHLRMVNLKNAYWLRTNGPEAAVAQHRVWWTSGSQGLASWPKVVAELRERGYRGTVCLPAEYSAEDQVDRLITQDLQFAKSLFAA